MKTIIVILILGIAARAEAQNLDSLLFVKVNDYRVYNSRPKLEFDSNCYKAAISHTTYMFKTKIVTHDEVSGRKAYTYAEVCNGSIAALISLDDTSSFNVFIKKIWKKNVREFSNEEIFVMYDVYTWSKSITHNTLILSNATKCGTSIKLGKIEKTNIPLFIKAKSAIFADFYSTISFN